MATCILVARYNLGFKNKNTGQEVHWELGIKRNCYMCNRTGTHRNCTIVTKIECDKG